jgi:hypothetical protein
MSVRAQAQYGMASCGRCTMHRRSTILVKSHGVDVALRTPHTAMRVDPLSFIRNKNNNNNNDEK